MNALASSSPTLSVWWHNEQRLLEVPTVKGMTVEALRCRLVAFAEVALQAKDGTAVVSIQSLRCGSTEFTELDATQGDLVEFHRLGSPAVFHLTTRKSTDLFFLLTVHLMKGGRRVKSTSAQVKALWKAETKTVKAVFPSPPWSFLSPSVSRLGLTDRPFEVFCGKQLIGEDDVAGLLTAAMGLQPVPMLDGKMAGEVELDLCPHSAHGFTVLVKPLTGKALTLSVIDCDTVEVVKRKVQAKTAMVPQRQRLVFEGRPLEDRRSLSGYGIGHLSTLRLVQRLTGGGDNIDSAFVFVDLRADKRGMKVIQWTKTAPRWCVVSPGLSIEGQCSNADCAAYGERVIVNKGFSKFNLEVDGQGPAAGEELASRTPCPECQQHVVPRTAAFNRCYWSWDGMKVRSGDWEELSASRWQYTGNEYHLFDPKSIEEGGAGTVTWSHLLLVAVKSDPRLDCGICAVPMGAAEGETLEGQLQCTHCHHRFHSACAGKWKKVYGRAALSSVGVPCPMCLAVLPVTGDKSSASCTEKGVKK